MKEIYPFRLRLNETSTIGLTPEMIEQLKADLKKAKPYKDLMGDGGTIKKIIKASLEGSLMLNLLNTWVTRNTDHLERTPIPAPMVKPTRR